MTKTKAAAAPTETPILNLVRWVTFVDGAATGVPATVFVVVTVMRLLVLEVKAAVADPEDDVIDVYSVVTEKELEGLIAAVLLAVILLSSVGIPLAYSVVSLPIAH